MKEVKIEVKSLEIKYEAIDGTTFDNKEECKKYEDTAKCVLLSRYNKLVVDSTTEYDLMQFGSDEQYIDIVKVNNEKDIDTIMQLFHYYNPSDYEIKYMEAKEASCKQALDTGDFLFINRGYSREDNFWIHYTMKELFDQFNDRFNSHNKDKEV